MFTFCRPHLKCVFFQKLRHILNLPRSEKLLIKAQQSKLKDLNNGMVYMDQRPMILLQSRSFSSNKSSDIIPEQTRKHWQGKENLYVVYIYDIWFMDLSDLLNAVHLVGTVWFFAETNRTMPRMTEQKTHSFSPSASDKYALFYRNIFRKQSSYLQLQLISRTLNASNKSCIFQIIWCHYLANFS